jgi:hypothetical protein
LNLNPQPINTNEPHDLVLQVFPTTKVVVDVALEVHGHCVDGQVAPLGVLFEVPRELHLGVPPVSLNIDPQRGDLEHLAINAQGDRPVGNAGGQVLELVDRCDVAHLVGRCISGKVQILGRLAQQRVPDTAAHETNLEAGHVKALAQLLRSRCHQLIQHVDLLFVRHLSSIN